MYRSRDWRRAQTEKKIAKRLDIIRNVWQYGFNDTFKDELEFATEKPHRYAKFNLNCGCTMCQANKHNRPEERFVLDNELEGWYDH